MRMRSSFLVLAAPILLATTAALAAPPRFAAPFLSYSSGYGPFAVTIADVNGDGRPDVLMSNSLLDTLGLVVRLGVGDGTLGPAILNTSNASPLVVVGDLDGDGKPDVVLAIDSLHVGARKGNGDGTFQPLVPFDVAKGPTAAVLADLNGDGHLDLVCTTPQAHAVSILLGDGAGGFGAHADLPLGASPGAIAAADLNHDGHVDVVVADLGTSALYVLLGDGAGHLALAGTVPLPAPPRTLALADLDGDGRLDAVAGSETTPAFFAVPGLPGGGFGAPVSLALANYVNGLAVDDLDGDGRPDVIALEYGKNGGEVRRGLGAFGFAPAQPFRAERDAFGIATADLNGGGKPDLVTICNYGPMSVHMGNGDGTFGGVQDLSMGPWPAAIASGDLDADGHADIVTSNIGDGSLSVRFGLGGGAFTAPLSLATGIEPLGVTIADADGDGHPDIVVAEDGPGTQTSSTVSVFRGNGARGFAPRATFTVGRWAQAVAVGDLTGDGIPDLAVACDDYLSTLTVLRGLGNGQWGDRQDWVLGSNASGVAIADVTRDGKPDVVLTAYDSNTVHVLPGNADGTYGSPLTLAVPHPRGVAVGDVAGDAAPDLIVSSDVGVSVFSSVPGGFAPRVDFPGGTGPIIAADLDGDGRIDVATANDWPSNAMTVWFGQSGGGLGAATAYGGGDEPSGVTAADVDGDGRLDLVSANLRSNSISLLLNTGGVAWLPWLGVQPGTGSLASFGLWASPNPAHGPVTVRYVLPRAAHVRLRLLDVAGRALAQFQDRDLPAGERRLQWSARGQPAGIAFLELEVGGDRAVTRIVVLP